MIRRLPKMAGGAPPRIGARHLRAAEQVNAQGLGHVWPLAVELDLTLRVVWIPLHDAPSRRPKSNPTRQAPWCAAPTAARASPSITLRAGEALSNPVGGLDSPRGIHALGSKALDIDQPHHLGVRVPLRSPSGHRLDGLMSVAKRKLDMAGRRIPFYADHSSGHLLARGFLATVAHHRLFDGDFQPEQSLYGAVVWLRWNQSRMCSGQCRHVPIV